MCCAVLLLVLVFPGAIHAILPRAESPIRPPDALLLFVPRGSVWSQFIKIQWFGITVSVPGVLENYLVTFFFSLLVIWAPHSRPAVQASDLVKDPKILLETFIKIQTVERNLTVQCVQLSSSSQSGFLPCYHLKMKGMHLYFFCPGRPCFIPTCIWVQAMGLSYYVEMGKKRPKLPSDRLCSFSPHAEKDRCAYWCITVAVRSEQESVLAAAR